MEQMTVTAKIQISVSDTDKVLLDNTLSVYRDACNYVSDYVFHTHDLKQFSLNKILYSDIRENFGYKSNDDRIGAMNLYRMGINYLEDSQVPNTVTAE